MAGVVKLIGIFMIVMGVIYFVKPSSIKKFINFWKREKNIYYGGAINIVIGLVFLVAASQCIVSWFIVVIGIINLAKGVLIFILGKEKIIDIMNKFYKKPLKELRFLGIIALILGVLLIYSI